MMLAASFIAPASHYTSSSAKGIRRFELECVTAGDASQLDLDGSQTPDTRDAPAGPLSYSDDEQSAWHTACHQRYTWQQQQHLQAQQQQQQSNASRNMRPAARHQRSPHSGGGVGPGSTLPAMQLLGQQQQQHHQNQQHRRQQQTQQQQNQQQHKQQQQQQQQQRVGPSSQAPTAITATDAIKASRDTGMAFEFLPSVHIPTSSSSWKGHDASSVQHASASGMGGSHSGADAARDQQHATAAGTSTDGLNGSRMARGVAATAAAARAVPDGPREILLPDEDDLLSDLPRFSSPKMLQATQPAQAGSKGSQNHQQAQQHQQQGGTQGSGRRQQQPQRRKGAQNAAQHQATQQEPPPPPPRGQQQWQQQQQQQQQGAPSGRPELPEDEDALLGITSTSTATSSSTRDGGTAADTANANHSNSRGRGGAGGRHGNGQAASAAAAGSNSSSGNDGSDAHGMGPPPPPPPYPPPPPRGGGRASSAAAERSAASATPAAAAAPAASGPAQQQQHQQQQQAASHMPFHTGGMPMPLPYGAMPMLLPSVGGHTLVPHLVPMHVAHSGSMHPIPVMMPLHMMVPVGRHSGHMGGHFVTGARVGAGRHPGHITGVRPATAVAASKRLEIKEPAAQRQQQQQERQADGAV